MMRRDLSALVSLVLITLLAGPTHANWRNVDGVVDLIGDTQPSESGLTLGLPNVSEDGSNITLNIEFTGSLDNGEYLEQIRVFAPGNPSPEVIDFDLSDAITKPSIRTRIRLAESQTVYAVARSSEGRTWVQSQDVRVTVSGCLMDSGESGELRMQNPRVALGNNPRAGQPLAMRTMINHPMETGLRDGENAPDIDEQLVEDMTVTQGERRLFTARFHSGTAENPYVMFHLTPEQSGTLTVTWTDQNGEQVQHDESLSL